LGGTAGTAVAVVDALYLAALVDGHRPRDSCPYCRGDEPHRCCLTVEVLQRRVENSTHTSKFAIPTQVAKSMKPLAP